MPEDSAKSCLMQMVKAVASIAAQVEAHSAAFNTYVLDERNNHNKIDAAILTLRSRLDTLIMGIGAATIILLLGVVGFLLVKVMGW